MSGDVTDNNAYGTVLESGAVRFERLLPGPIERVWNYIVDPDKRATWLAGGKMDLRVGGRVELFFRHNDLSDVKEMPPEKYRQYEGGVGGVSYITQIDPPRLLAMTWNEKEDSTGASANASEVTFELTPKGDNVLLVLTHRRLASHDKMVSTASGWHTHLAIMVEHINGRATPPFWSRHTRLEKEYDARLSA